MILFAVISIFIMEKTGTQIPLNQTPSGWTQLFGTLRTTSTTRTTELHASFSVGGRVVGPIRSAGASKLVQMHLSGPYLGCVPLSIQQSVKDYHEFSESSLWF